MNDRKYLIYIKDEVMRGLLETIEVENINHCGECFHKRTSDIDYPSQICTHRNLRGRDGKCKRVVIIRGHHTRTYVCMLENPLYDSIKDKFKFVGIDEGSDEGSYSVTHGMVEGLDFKSYYKRNVNE